MYTKKRQIIDLLSNIDNKSVTLHTIAVKYFDLGGAMRASDKAYQTLLDEIVEGSLAPGTVLAEVEQAARLGVSRTPLREALAHLRKDGLIEPLAGRGLIVTAVSIDDIVELYELRQPLEQQAARLAAQRGNPQIFSQIAAEFRDSDRLISSGAEGIKAYYQLNERLDRAIEDSISSAYLVSALKGLHLHLARIRRLSRQNVDRLRAAAVETLVIVEAIVNRDADLAASATHVHLQQSLRNSLATVRTLTVDRVA
jgi:DNA-binding GntR family transcriptional regulator